MQFLKTNRAFVPPPLSACSLGGHREDLLGRCDRTQLSGGGEEDKRVVMLEHPSRSHHRIPTVTINVGQYFNRIRLSLTESSGRARKATSRWRGQQRRWTGEVGADAPRPKRSRMPVHVYFVLFKKKKRHLVWQHRRMSCDCHRHSHTSRSGLGCKGMKPYLGCPRPWLQSDPDPLTETCAVRQHSREGK